MPAEPYDASDLPTGLDRADGLKGRLGTASGPDQVAATSAGGSGVDNLPVEEFADSPTLIRAEKGTVEHRFRLPWNDAYTRMYGYHRGLVRTSSTDTDSERYFLLEARMQRDTGGRAIVTTVEEALDYDSPPDRFSVTPVELGLNIIKHPRYFYAFIGSGYGSNDEKINQCVIRLLQDYMSNSNYLMRNAIQKIIYDSLESAGTVGSAMPEWNGSSFSVTTVPGTKLAKLAALEIIQKYWRGVETPYIVGWQITWSRYFFRPPLLHPGGIIQDPMLAEPPLPEYFWSTADPPDWDSDSIFDGMAQKNPQCYAANGQAGGTLAISWLRKADQLEFQRTWFKLHSTWIGTPVGHWDQHIYGYTNRPTLANNTYVAINPTT